MNIDLTGLWRFQPDPTGSGAGRGYAELNYDDHRWWEVHVPVDFDTAHPALDSYEGSAWFRRWVEVPAEWEGRRLSLRFEGVNAHAQVWVNGFELGSCDDPFLPFEFTVEDRLAFGRKNLIVVRVDNERRPGDVPGLQRGWRNYGGILREVLLTATDPCYLDRFVVQAVPGETGGHIDLQAFVRNTRREGVNVVLEAAIETRDGRELARFASAPHLVPVGEEVPLAVEGLVPGAEAWAPDHPVLYCVVAELRLAGESSASLVRASSEPIHHRTFHVGFRSIEAHDGQLLLNGKPVVLTGFNRHEDSPTTNMCFDPDLVRRDLTAMKEAGANFVRLCHYPHHPVELDLCDELGLLVMDEIPLYWWDGLAEGDEAATDKLAAAKRQLRTLIARDRTHPSVIFWSVSNETQEDRPEVAAGNDELVRLAQALDTTRLATHVSDHWQAHPNFAADDVICVNGYPSVNALLHDAEASYDPSEATDYWREGLAALHAQYPDKPILVTEFGAVSFYGIVDGAYSGEQHADAIKAEYAGMMAPYVCGSTIWCWADHAWPPNFFAFCNYLSISPYGVVTRDRHRKPPFATVRQLFRERQGLPMEAGTRNPFAERDAGIDITMVRPNLDDIPQYELPDGFSIRTMRPDDVGLWNDIWRDAEPFFTVDEHLFENQFGHDQQATQWRTFIVEDERGVAVGTTSAWYNRNFKGEDYGQIHWVAVRQAYWGRGLGKAMMTHALNEMAKWHDRAFLGTQTKRIPAIKVYLDFGFVPDLERPGAVVAWQQVKEQLNHPVLEAMEELQD